MRNLVSDEEFEIIKEQILEKLIILKYFKSEKVDGKELISITLDGVSKLEDIIEQISKLILKEKPSWINLLSLNQLFLIQTELLKGLFVKPEFALLHLSTEEELENLEILAKDYIKLIENDLIELTPQNKTLH